MGWSIPILGGREGSLSPKAKDKVRHVGLLLEVFLGVGQLLERSCNINPLSSAKNVNVLYVEAEVAARLGLIRVLEIVNVPPSCRRGISGEPSPEVPVQAS
ncbi:hypothetical protein B296_00000913 [Ensete ventricosum]|uniref:Uncharacterized protein n=1 Tax=Ensete ventricosum TaxID=4639 RepID=A0A427AL84_ENSVE|nr:hypothetical protein B296_00000913 [Ensete ventricosum]